MSNPSPTIQPTMPTKFTVPLTKNSYVTVTWAKPKETVRQTEDGRQVTSPVIAEFSTDLYIDGIKVMSGNSQKLLSFVDNGTGKERLQLGSMHSTMVSGSRDNPREKKIYALAWFPGREDDKIARENRDGFTTKVIAAVQEFIEEQNRRLKEQAERPAPQRQTAQQFAQLRTQQMRTFGQGV